MIRPVYKLKNRWDIWSEIYMKITLYWWVWNNIVFHGFPGCLNNATFTYLVKNCSKIFFVTFPVPYLNIKSLTVTPPPPPFFSLCGLCQCSMLVSYRGWKKYGNSQKYFWDLHFCRNFHKHYLCLIAINSENYTDWKSKLLNTWLLKLLESVRN